jgi:hypothetical protein
VNIQLAVGILVKLASDGNAASSSKFRPDCGFTRSILSHLTTCGEKATEKLARIFDQPAAHGMLDLQRITLQNAASNPVDQ